jgi:hypothetical protein
MKKELNFRNKVAYIAAETKKLVDAMKGKKK